MGRAPSVLSIVRADLGPAQRGASGGAGEDDVLHLAAAQALGALLAHDPRQGVDDVGLARAVGAHDARDARLEVQRRRGREGLESPQGEALEVHRALAPGRLCRSVAERAVTDRAGTVREVRPQYRLDRADPYRSVNPLVVPRAAVHCSVTPVTRPGRRVVDGCSASCPRRRSQTDRVTLGHDLHAPVGQVGGVPGQAQLERPRARPPAKPDALDVAAHEGGQAHRAGLVGVVVHARRTVGVARRTASRGGTLAAA